MVEPSNIKVSQSFSLPSPAVSGHSRQSIVCQAVVQASSDDKLVVLCFNATRLSVSTLLGYDNKHIENLLCLGCQVKTGSGRRTIGADIFGCHFSVIHTSN